RVGQRHDDRQPRDPVRFGRLGPRRGAARLQTDAHAAHRPLSRRRDHSSRGRDRHLRLDVGDEPLGRASSRAISINPPTIGKPYPKYRQRDLDSRGQDRPSWSYDSRRRRRSLRRSAAAHRQACGDATCSGGSAGGGSISLRMSGGMRLASKIFLTSAVVVVVLGVVGILSLRAVGRLASVNREITTRTVPALRLAASTREAVPALVRLEARFLVLDDTRFIGAWNERADRLRASLIRLREYTTTPHESLP